MMFCGLVLSVYPLWDIPTMAITHGGGFFLAFVVAMNILIAFPVIHLEIFVGQRHQSGICKVFRSYGWAYEGLGAAIFIVTFLSSLEEIILSYVDVNHIKEVFTNITDIVSCDSPRFQGHSCSSIYNDHQCKLMYSSFDRYWSGQCQTEIEFTRETSSTELYYDYYLTAFVSTDFDIKQMFYFFTLFTIYAFISVFGERTIRLLLATIYAIFMLCFVSTVTKFLSTVNIDTAMDIFWIITTPESLLSFKTYLRVLEMTFRSGGVMLYGVMSASSFRRKSGNTYRLAMAIMLNNLFISFLSFAYTIGIAAYLTMKSYAGFNFTPRDDMVRFYITSATDAVFSSTEDYIWVTITLFPSAIAKLVTFFPPIMLVYGITRDFKRHQWSASIIGTTTVCVGGFLIAASSCYQPNPFYFLTLIDDIQGNYELVLIAMAVVVFVHIYGNQEYLVDLNEVYPENDNSSVFIEPTSSIYFAIYKFMPFLLGFFSIMYGSKILRALSDLDYDPILLFTVVFVILVYFFHNLFVLYRRKELWMLFSITPEHPSYNRIHHMKLFETEENPISADQSDFPVVQVTEKNTSSTKTAPLMDIANIKQFYSDDHNASDTKSAEKGSAETQILQGRGDGVVIRKDSKRTDSAEKGSAEFEDSPKKPVGLIERRQYSRTTSAERASAETHKVPGRGDDVLIQKESNSKESAEKGSAESGETPHRTGGIMVRKEHSRTTSVDRGSAETEKTPDGMGRMVVRKRPETTKSAERESGEAERVPEGGGGMVLQKQSSKRRPKASSAE